MMINKKMAGLSLLEMMCVLIIMSMLTSFSITRWQLYQQKLQLDNASRHLMTFLMRMQFSANQLNRNYQIQLPEPNLVSAIDQESDQLIALFDELKHNTAINLSSSNIASSIVFYGQRNMASAGHFSVVNAFAEIRVIISARGRIRRCVHSLPDDGSSIMGIPAC